MKKLSVRFRNSPVTSFVSRECQLVAMLSRTPLTASQRSNASVLIDGGIDWTRVLRLAEHWEVEPVFFTNLAQCDAGVPESVIELARTRGLRARSRVIAAVLWTSEVLRQMDEAGIACILLKGPALGVLAYDDFSGRTFSDADLLVRKEDLTRAQARLESVGFMPEFQPNEFEMLISNGHALEFSNNGRKVELHWTLLSRHLRLDLSVNELWRSSFTIEIAGRQARTLDRSNLFIFLCAHGAKHEWERFRWLCDVAQLGDRLTHEELERAAGLARRYHARRIVMVAIEMARSLAGSGLQEARSLSPGDTRLVARLVQRAATHYEELSEDHPSPGAHDFDSRIRALKYWLSTRERVRDRALVLARTFISPIHPRQRRRPLAIIHRTVRLISRVVRRSSS